MGNAEWCPLADKVVVMGSGLKYTGRGEYLQGVPMRDLSAEELLGFSAEERARIERSGLWVGEMPRPLGDIKGIGEELMAALAGVGLVTAEQVRQADDRALLAISGIGVKRLAEIRAAVGPRVTE